MQFYNNRNRVDQCATNAEKRVEALRATGKDLKGQPIEESLKNLDKEMAITLREHHSFQNTQSQAFAMQQINQDESLTICTALGESLNPDNGGWQPHVTLSHKVAVTQVMAELLTIQRKENRNNE
jgi:hypothetical protein